MERMGKSADDMEIIGASENNLKHIDVTIPKGKLVLFVGASGSGKKLSRLNDAMINEKYTQQR